MSQSLPPIPSPPPPPGHQCLDVLEPVVGEDVTLPKWVVGHVAGHAALVG